MSLVDLADRLKSPRVVLGPEKLIIERLDNSKSYASGNGYRFSDQWRFAFYDIYWNRVSGHYLIQEAYRLKQLNLRWGIKPRNGPYALEILEPETSEEAVDRKCLERLISIIKRNYPDVNVDIPSNFDLLEFRFTNN